MKKTSNQHQIQSEAPRRGTRMSMATGLTGFQRGRGATMVFTLVILLALACAAVYVLQLGRQTQLRELTQFSARMAGESGGAWVARSLNTVAMNNRGMAHMLTSVAVLDALPEATRGALSESNALTVALKDAMSSPAPGWSGKEHLDRTPLAMLEMASGHLERHAGTIQAAMRRGGINADGLSPRIDAATLYHTSDGGHGRLWRAMAALEELNHSTMEHLGVLAQLNAVRGGVLSLQGNTVDTTAVLLPGLPEVPWRRGTFADLVQPLHDGLPLLPEETWHDEELVLEPAGGHSGHGHRVPRSYGVSPIQAARGNLPISDGVQPLPRPAPVSPDAEALILQPASPPVPQFLDLVRNMSRTMWGDISFARAVEELARVKISYASAGAAAAERQFTRAHWITDVEQVQTIIRNEPARIRQAMFLVVQVRSRFPADHAEFMTKGSFVVESNKFAPGLNQVLIDQWSAEMDPQQWVASGRAKQLGNRVYRDEWSYETRNDRAIGIARQVDDKGKVIPAKVYRIDDFIFVGVNVGQDAVVRNPFNYRAGDKLPAPALLVPPPSDVADAAPREAIRLLAIAEHNGRGPFGLPWWPAWGGGAKPVAFAETRVISNADGTLWTQAWNMQLQESPDWPAWTGKSVLAHADLLTPIVGRGVLERADQNLRTTPAHTGTTR